MIFFEGANDFLQMIFFFDFLQMIFFEGGGNLR